MAKAPNTPSATSGSSDDPSWMRDQQNPTTPDSDVADSIDQPSRDAEAARQAGTSQTGTAQGSTTQQ